MTLNTVTPYAFSFISLINLYNKITKKGPNVSDQETHGIKEEIQPFLNKQNIRKDLLLVFNTNPKVKAYAKDILGASAIGSNLFEKPAIVAHKKLYEIDKEAFHFIIKHEIRHIKYNDALLISSLTSMVRIAACAFSNHHNLSFLPALALMKATGDLFEASLGSFLEGKADDFAIQNSSDEELKGGRRFFISMQKVIIAERSENNTYSNRVFLTSNGNNRLDIGHTSITSRIQKIENALHARRVDVHIEEDREKIANITSLIREAIFPNRTTDVEKKVQLA